MHKPITIFFLLFVFLFNTIGYFITYKTLQLKVHNKLKENIHDNKYNKKFYVFSFYDDKQSELIWEVKDKEFEFNGKWFDIIRTIKENGKTTYYCIDDVKEDRLFSFLSDYIDNCVKSDSGSGNSGSKKINSKILELYLISPELQLTSYSIRSFETTNFFSTSFYFPPCLVSGTPPPEFV